MLYIIWRPNYSVISMSLLTKIKNDPVKKLADKKTIFKFIANTWLNNSVGEIRTKVMSDMPKYHKEDKIWKVDVIADTDNRQKVGEIHIDKNLKIVYNTKISMIQQTLNKIQPTKNDDNIDGKFVIKNHKILLKNSIAECKKLKNKSIDLLLTDPPYGISSPYSAEKQIPRRLRKNGSDFIMPKGEFGEWDHGFSPHSWTDIIIPKISGWVVIFCAHTQIKEYSDILLDHGFVAVGTLAWHKTNPVPFNHKFKLLSSYESAVVGKRPSTKFNGKSVHNVFTFKSPSPHHRIHPTQKPLELMQILIELFTDVGDKILDPFAGSCTTTLAAIKTKRKSISYESDMTYYNSAINRIKNHLEGAL